MGTSPENTLTNFDLDLLLCSASSSLSESTDLAFQFQNVETTQSSHNYQVQNVGIHESADYSNPLHNQGNQDAPNNYHIQIMDSNQHYQLQMDSYGNSGGEHQAQNELSYSSQTEEMVKKSDYEALKSNYQKLSANFASLQNNYQSKNKDYDAMKKQYAKLASDFSNLHKENSEHAMGSLTISAKCEHLEKKVVEYLATIKALTARCEQNSLEIYAQSKQFIQYQSHVEDLMAQISTLKSNVQTEKNNGKDSRKMISTLTSNNETLKEHLCLFACVIEGRKQLERESRRLIRKYCKKGSSTKKSIESESFENHSVDTGRGSSLAYSDGERSFYSPSYTFSPLSAGNVTPQNELSKVMRDATTSPLPIAVTLNVSTSPIIFEEVRISVPAVKTNDVFTNTIICHEDKSSMTSVETRDVGTSVEFNDTKLSTKIPTINIATSPVQFDDSSYMAKTRTANTGSSPIVFDDASTVANTRTINTATSPILFDDVRLLAKTKTSSVATSPLRFDYTSLVTKTSNTASSPIMFDDASTVDKTRRTNTATSPIIFDDSSPRTKTRKLNVATSPVILDDSSSRTKTRTHNVATSPVIFNDSNPRTKTRTHNVATSPVIFNDSNPRTKTRTHNVATSPVIFDDSSPRIKARTHNVATSPVVLNDTGLVTKTKTLNTATSPILFDKTNPVTKLPTLNIDDLDLMTDRDLVTAISPITVNHSSSGTKTNTPALVTSPVQSSTKKETGTTRHGNDVKCSSVETIVHTENNLITMNSIPVASQKRKQIPKPVTKKSITKSSCHINQISEKLKEIVSEQVNSLMDKQNDMEINMILSKCKMSWDLLSPLSLSPVAHQVSKGIQSEKEEQPSNEGDQSLAQSLYLSEDEDSDNDRDMVESHIIELPIENPPREANTNINFDLLKSSSERVDNTKCNIYNSINESHTEISNKKHNNTNIPSIKRKKLTKLQKIYKANARKSLINIDDVSCVARRELDPKPQTMSPAKLSVHNDKAKEIKRFERNLKLQHNKEDPVKVCKENVISSNKEPIKLHTDIGKVETSRAKDLTYILPKTDTTHIKLFNSTENQLESANVPQTSIPESSKTQPQVRVTESASNKCIKTSVIQWNGTCKLPHAQEPAVELVQKKVLNSTSDLHTKDLPKSEPNKKSCPAKDTQKNKIIISTHTRTHPKPVSGIRKRCVAETQPSHTNGPIDKQPPLLRIEITKADSKQESSNDLPQCLASIPPLIEDVGFSYPKPTHKRVSRVRKDITTNLFMQSDQIEISTNDKICNPSKNRLKRAADAIINGLDVKRKKDCSLKNTSEIDTNVNQDIGIDEPVGVSSGESKDKQNEILHITHVDVSKTSDTSDVTCLVKSGDETRSHADYNDMALFTASKARDIKKQHLSESWTNNILDRMVFKYGARPSTVKTLNCKNEEAVALQIKNGIDKCVKCISKPDEYTKTTQQFISELQCLGKQKIVTGMMKYLNDPARKSDFIIGTVKFMKKGFENPPATKTEMALIDVIQLLDQSGIVTWDLILDGLEFILFNLERGATPGFEVIESVAHFYANICRYQRNVSRLWLFMLNAMYCLTFKAIPLIKHCLDVMPEVLPYSSTYLGPGLAPLIRCFVFLLNFYNCEDRFKRMDAIRRLLKYKYYYNMQDENETTLLFLLKESIVNLTESKLERDMLELSFLIVAKRKGTKWCHKNLVQKIIMPMIKGESEVSYRAKRFCITTIGHLMKPYNNEMTVHTEEVVNMLINMFEQESQTHEMKEDIIRGLLNLNMSTLSIRINACLFKWNPPSVSAELEEALQIYVNRKNMKTWHVAYKNYYKEI